MFGIAKDEGVKKDSRPKTTKGSTRSLRCFI